MPSAALRKATRLGAMALLILASGFVLRAGKAQQPGFRRIELQRHDLSVPGREVVQTRVELDPGVKSPKHYHPGEEIVYVLEGPLEFQLDDQPPVTLKPGGILFIPAGTVHTAKNVGTGSGVELATYFLQKGRPIATIVK